MSRAGVRGEGGAQELHMRNYWCPSVVEGMRPSAWNPRPESLLQLRLASSRSLSPASAAYLPAGAPLGPQDSGSVFQVAQEAQSSGRTPAPAPQVLPQGLRSALAVPLLGAATSRDLAFCSLSVPMNCLRCQSLLGQTDRRPDNCSLVQLPELRHHLFSVFSLPFLPSQLPAGQGPSISV